MARIPTGNRRRHQRVALRVPVGIACADAETVMEAKTFDVSVGGLSVGADQAIEVGDEVIVVINAGERIIPARAKVVRRAPAPALMGIEFVGLTPGPMRNLRRWLGSPPNPETTVASGDEGRSQATDRF